MADRKQSSRRGNQIVEFAIILTPFLALVFLVFDTAWGVFVKATLQNAAQSGARYAVTGTQFASVASIQAYVAAQSAGLVQASTVQVSYPTSGGATVVLVTIPYTYSPLATILPSLVPINLTATAGDMMEPGSSTQ